MKQIVAQQWYSMDEAREIMGVSATTLGKWVAQGYHPKLETTKHFRKVVHRVQGADLAAFLSQEAPTLEFELIASPAVVPVPIKGGQK